MSKRTSLVALAGMLGCLVLLLCIGTTTFAGYYLYTNVSPGRPVNRIAYVDNEMDIQVVDAQGGQRMALTTDAAGSPTNAHIFPTWSPDSQHVAFVSLSGDSDQRQASLDVASLAGGGPKSVFKSGTDVPLYLYWSPDGKRIGFLTQGDKDMSLMLAAANAQDDTRKLGSGAPLYWAWSPDSQTMLLHAGGSRKDSADAYLSLLDARNGKPQELPDGPASFLAPQFSPDGSSLLYASSGGSTSDSLFRADRHGKNPQLIQTFQGSIAFAWSPDGKSIATLVTPEDSRLPHSGPISVSNAEGKNLKPLVKEDALAFFWSPDSRQIAYLTLKSSDGSGCAFGCTQPLSLSGALGVQAGKAWPGGKAQVTHGVMSGRARGAPLFQTPAIQLLWRVVSLADGQARTLATFEPTDTFLAVLPFFDQYARSLTFWSPDSRQFVYTTSESDTNGGVLVIDLAQGAQPRRVGDGTFAVWSWH